MDLLQHQRFDGVTSTRSSVVDVYPKPVSQNDHSFITHKLSPSSSKIRLKEIVLYKTEFCRNWTELGNCRYGSKCRYAHGQGELRAAPRHSLYKTQICRAYHDQGECPYGIRCTFIHDDYHQVQHNVPQKMPINIDYLPSSPVKLSLSPSSSCSSVSGAEEKGGDTSLDVSTKFHSHHKSSDQRQLYHHHPGVPIPVIKYQDLSLEYIYPCYNQYYVL